MMKNPIRWRETVQVNQRAFRIFFKQYPQTILSRLSSVIWNALAPYIGIYFSALIIDELAGGRDPERLFRLVVTTLIVGAVSALVTALLNRWQKIQDAGLFYKVDAILIRKMLDMDYVNCEDTRTADLMYQVYQNQNGGSWGLFRVVEQCERLGSAVFTMLGGIVLTVSLFTSRVAEGSHYRILNHPLIVLLTILLMLGITLLAPALSNKGESYWAKNADAHSYGNRIGGFFGYLGYKKELAADVRMYAQDKICEKHNVSKEGVFSSNGLFAHLSWGPMGLYNAAAAAVSVVFTGLVYGFVCIKAWAGAFGLGVVTQYAASILKVSEGVSELISTMGDIRNNTAFLKQVFAFLDIPDPMYQGSLTVEKRRDRKYEIEFRNVSFRYPGSVWLW